MSLACTIYREIICCPECLKKRKIKRFKSDSDVNRHLAQKHKSSYTIRIESGKTLFIPRMRQKAISSNNL